MADSTTTTYSFTLPEVGASADSWGTKLNANWSKVDDLFDGTVAVTGINLTTFKVDSVIVTASAAELNKLDGLTATTTELNYVDGVTSNIQTQLDAMVEKAGDTMTGDLSFGDNVKAKFGASDDLQIYHDGSHSYIDEQGTGRLYINSGNGVWFANSDGSEISAKLNVDSACEFRYDNAIKLTTTATGVDVTGTVTADGLEASASSGAEVTIGRNDTLLVNGDLIGGIKFKTNDASTAYGTPPYYSAGIKAKASGTVGLMDLHLYAGQTNNAYEEDTPSLTLSSNGDVSFYEDTGTTAKFVWDSSAEALGLRTSSPTGILDLNISTNARGYFSDVVGEVGSGNFALQVVDSAGTSLKPFGIRAEDIRFVTGSTERLRIDSSGNVGIGTASPQKDVHIVSTGGGSIRLERNDSALQLNDSIGSIDFRQQDPSSDGAGVVSKIESINESSFRGAAGLSFSTGDASTLTERMRINAAGNVGIGTDSPSSPSSFAKTAEISDASSASYSVNGAGTDAEMGASSSGAWLGTSNTSTNKNLRFVTNGSERARIDSSGNLLVGKTAENTATAGFQARANGLIAAGRSGNPSAYFNRLSSDGDIALFAKDGTTVGSIGTDKVTTGSNSITLDSGSNGRVTIDGLVQFIATKHSSAPRLQPSTDATTDLGTGSNRFKDLYLSGGVKLGETCLVEEGTGGDLNLQNTNASGDVFVNSARNTRFFNAGSEKVRIDSSGRLLHQTTSSSTYPTGTVYSMFGTGGDVTLKLGGYGTTHAMVQFLMSGNNVKGSITSTQSATNYNTTSDERLKENIVDTTHSVNIDDIRVREYDWKVDGSHQRFGFIAQELETVYPEAVYSPEDEDEMKAVDYSKLVPLLVKEIQTLKARIETLENK